MSDTLTPFVVEQLIGCKIRNFSLYRDAFTHRSADHECNYEALEHYGDKHLGSYLSDYVFAKYDSFKDIVNSNTTNDRERLTKYLDPGILTKISSKLTCGKTLSMISKNLEFDTFILMNEKGMKNGWTSNPKKLEDTFEAFVGAIKYDLGAIPCRNFVINTFFHRPDIIDITQLDFDDNHKDKLQQLCQKHAWTIEYNQLGHFDPKMFRMAAVVNGVQTGTGKGSTKKDAEQEAAYFSLWRIVEQMRNDPTVDHRTLRQFTPSSMKHLKPFIKFLTDN